MEGQNSSMTFDLDVAFLFLGGKFMFIILLISMEYCRTLIKQEIND
jgi:hypothetical protein